MLGAGCPQGTDCSDPTNAEACGKEAVTIILTTESDVVRLKPGEHATLKVTVERKGDWEGKGSVTLDAVDLVGGVTMTPVELTKPDNEATIEFSATDAVATGVFPFRLIARPQDYRIPLSDIQVEIVVPGPSGSPDLSFGTSGAATYGQNGREFRILGTELDAHGRVLVVGYDDADNDPYDPIIFRFFSTGQLDEDFSEAVEVISNESIYRDVVSLPNGDIFTASQEFDEGGELTVTVSKYQDNGQLDMQFGNGGAAVTENLFSDLARVRLIARTEDLLLIGRDKVRSFDFSGHPNNAFGADSVLHALPILLQETLLDTDEVFAIGVYEEPHKDLALVIGDDATEIEGDIVDLATAVKELQPDAYYADLDACDQQSPGYLVCVGIYGVSHGTGSDLTGMLLRLSVDAELDATFGQGGLILGDSVASLDTTMDQIRVVGDQKFLTCEAESSADDVHFYVTGFHPDGEVDTSFGSDGRTEVLGCSEILVNQRYGMFVMVNTTKEGEIQISRYWLWQ